MALKDTANLALIPAAYKTSKVYSAIPTDGDGDFTFSRSGNATRVNKAGLVETMGTNVPRLNYDLTNGTPASCPSLLLEPTRTNLAQNSNELNTGWAHSECTLTPNQVVAPDGSNTGSFVERTSTVQARVERGINVTDQNYTWSCFVKKGNQKYAFLNVYLNTSAVSVSTIFDFDTESIVFSSSAVITNSVVEYPNGWYRLTTTFDALASQTAFVKVGSTSSATVFSTGNVGDTIYVWGAQLEAGSYPTSYIPTTIAVTRTADRCTGGGNDALFNDSEGVLFADLEALGEGTTVRKISLSNGGTDFVNFNFNATSGRVDFEFGSTSNSFYIVNSTGHTLTDRNKIAIKYKSGDTDCYINGIRVTGSNGTFTLSGLDRLNTEGRATNGTQRMYAKINEIMVFNEALTDAELITLTT